jgi:anti-sigma factor RsiW
MYCEEARRKVNAYLDGELAGEAAALVREHLDGCPQCSEELYRLKQLNSLLDGLPGMVAPEGFPRKVRERASQPGPGTGRLTVLAEWFSTRSLAGVAAVLALAAGVLTGGFLSTSMTRVKDQQAVAEAQEPAPDLAVDPLSESFAWLPVSNSQQNGNSQ